MRQMNAPQVVVERLRLCTITPGTESHSRDFSRHHAPGGVDTVCVVFDVTEQQQQKQLELILVCAASLLSGDAASRVWLLVLHQNDEQQPALSRGHVQSAAAPIGTGNATAMRTNSVSSSVQGWVHFAAAAAGLKQGPPSRFWDEFDKQGEIGVIGGQFIEFVRLSE